MFRLPETLDPRRRDNYRVGRRESGFESDERMGRKTDRQTEADDAAAIADGLALANDIAAAIKDDAAN